MLSSRYSILIFLLFGLWSCGSPLIDRDTKTYRYSPPFEKGGRFLVSQSFHGKKTHKGLLNEYAVDIVMPIGTKICAAREGVIIGVVDQNMDGYSTADLPMGTVNYVRVLHDDGTVALYAHLKKGSVVFQKGKKINKHQCFAQSGNSGNSTGPHLHFAILEVNGKFERSRFFVFTNRDGRAIMPEYLKWLYS